MPQISTTASIDYVVEYAPPSQTAAVLTLLPELLTAPSLPSRFIIAYAKENPSHILAATAVIPQLISTEWPGFNLHCHVLADFRRIGIGSAMLKKIVSETLSWGVPYLHVASHLEDESAAARFLRQQKFIPSSNMHHFVSNSHATLPMLDRLVKALHRSKRIPAGFVLQSLANANLDQVAALFALQFGRPLAYAHHIVQQALNDPLCNEFSLCLSNGQDLAGFLIVKQGQDYPEVGYWVSDPTYRQGWPAAVLLEGFVRSMHDQGRWHAAYSCNDKTVATLNIAKKSGAILTAIKRSYMLQLEQY